MDESGCADSVARLEAAIASHPGVEGVPLSIATGRASCPPAGSLLDAQRVADARMYEHKREPMRSAG